jgi:hypothetical protein
MATSNDRAILNSIINPLVLPNDEFKALDDAREDIDETGKSTIL